MKYAVEVDLYPGKKSEIFAARCERVGWCAIFIGKRGVDWAITTKQHDIIVFSFKEEAHAALFKLKWV